VNPSKTKRYCNQFGAFIVAWVTGETLPGPSHNWVWIFGPHSFGAFAMRELLARLFSHVALELLPRKGGRLVRKDVHGILGVERKRLPQAGVQRPLRAQQVFFRHGCKPSAPAGSAGGGLAMGVLSTGGRARFERP
jgi:hypothetical protein